MAKIYMLILITLFACSHNKRSSSTVSMAVGSLMVPDLSAYHLGGAMMIGVNHDSGDRFAINLSDLTSELELELANGRWSFAGILWNGVSAFTGDVYCAIKQQSLEGGDVDLSMSFDRLSCADERFVMVKGSDSLNELVIKGRKTNEIKPLSYLVKLNTFAEGVKTRAGQGLTSGCFTVNAKGDVYTGLRLPFGNGELPFEIEVQAFTDRSCTDGRQEKIVAGTDRLAPHEVKLMKYVEGKTILFYQAGTNETIDANGSKIGSKQGSLGLALEEVNDHILGHFL